MTEKKPEPAHQEPSQKLDQPPDVSVVIAKLSHELRTPLASILGYVDLILEEDAGPITEQQKAFLEIILQNTLKLEKLVNTGLDQLDFGTPPKPGPKSSLSSE
jgi:signal transduction histidine kinase